MNNFNKNGMTVAGIGCCCAGILGVCATLFAVAFHMFTAFLTHGAGTIDAKHELLLQARAGFTTHLLVYKQTPDNVPIPPAGVLNLVRYPAPLGSYPAYLSPPPTNHQRYPAIIWLAGGFDNSIDDTFWAPATPDNDQSASAFRQAGIVTMYPSLRGGNNNPGYIENFYGEVDDVLAAAKYLQSLPFVDPNRIYLGGHSTGGTLALLVDESTPQFRAVFACGPVAWVSGYDRSDLTFDYNDPREVELRSPMYDLAAITSPTVVLEGQILPSNIESVRTMAAKADNSNIRFLAVHGHDHFSELAVTTPMMAQWILHDNGPAFQIPASSLQSSDLDEIGNL